MPLRKFSLRAVLLGVIASTLALGGCSWVSDDSEAPSVREPLVPPVTERQLVPASPPQSTPRAVIGTPPGAIPTAVATTPNPPAPAAPLETAVDPPPPTRRQPRLNSPRRRTRKRQLPRSHSRVARRSTCTRSRPATPSRTSRAASVSTRIHLPGTTPRRSARMVPSSPARSCASPRPPACCTMSRSTRHCGRSPTAMALTSRQ